VITKFIENPPSYEVKASEGKQINSDRNVSGWIDPIASQKGFTKTH